MSMPQKQCPNCQSMQHRIASKCKECGHQFTSKAKKKKKRAEPVDESQFVRDPKTFRFGETITGGLYLNWGSTGEEIELGAEEAALIRRVLRAPQPEAKPEAKPEA